VLRAAGINVEKTENVVFAGAEAACARIQVGRAPQAAVLEEIQRGCADVLSISVRPL
jgi:D-3-phosphoglycerate dehydrogenase